MIGLAATPAFANTVPDAPAVSSVAGSSIGGVGHVIVTFTAPLNDGGDPISSYTATCVSSDSGATGSGSTPSGTVVPINVTALTSGTHYTCTVVATNLDGDSLPSAASASAYAASAPNAPAAPTVTRGSGTLIASFGTPANNGDAITGYTATCTSSNGGAVGSASHATSPVTVPGVTNGKSYTCHVRATNAVGSSADSPESSPPVVVSVAPGAPSVPTLTSGNGQIRVAFTPGATSGDPVVANTASCTNGGPPATATAASSPITVTGLSNGSSYTCTVTSSNGAGTGPASPSSSIVAGLPDAPGQPAVGSADSALVVSFNPPSLNGSPLVGYTAACLSSNGGGVAFGSAASSPITATGAANGKVYTCHVTASNTIGAGPDSPESVAISPAGIPDPPDKPTVTPTNNGMQVAFTAPFNNGAAISSYTATCTPVGAGATGSASAASSPITVTGLTNGSTYTCNVSATNSAGSSSPSDESDPAGADAVPNAPAKPTVTGGGSRIAVSFVLPAENGAPIFKTSAICTSSNGGVTRSAFTQPEDLDETFSPISVPGVTNGKTYTCKVTATNDVGTSPPSPASSAVIPRGAPTAPTGVRATSGNATGSQGPVNVFFTPGSANGSPITSFRATCTDMSTALKVARTGTRSPILVGGLTTGHTFSCVAQATNAGGTSVSSAASKVVLGAPGMPTITRVVDKNRSLTLSLLAPSGNGKPITQYVALCTSSNGGAKRGSASVGGSIVVSQLSLGASYTCTVTARNARGAGLAAKVGPITITK